MQLLGAEAPIGGEAEFLDSLRQELERAHDRGFQRGLIAAGEPWVALFFGLAGALLGWAAHVVWNAT